MHPHQMPNGANAILLSADHHELVRTEAAAILDYCRAHPRVPPERIADMVFRTRVPRRHRTLLWFTDRDGMLSALQAIAQAAEHPSVVRGTRPAESRSIAFVFPGQGGQRPGMGRLFYDRVEAYRAEADRCAAQFQAQFGLCPIAYLRGETAANNAASVVQPALFTQMAGLAAMWRASGVTADTVVGHSQGEIAAAYVCGAMTLTDAVAAVGIRATMVDTFESGDYAMAVAATDKDVLERLLARRTGWAEVSAVNSPSMTAISGDAQTVQAVVDTLTEEGVFSRIIPVRYPAHTSMMNALSDKIRRELSERMTNTRFTSVVEGSDQTACIGATLGETITGEFDMAEYWFWNLRNTVRFDKAIAAALELGVDTFVELAEHPSLQLAVQENCTAHGAGSAISVVGTSIRDAAGLDEFTANLATIATGDLGYRWDVLAGPGSATPPALPLRDFPNAPTKNIRLWLTYNEPERHQLQDTSAAPVAQTAPGERIAHSGDHDYASVEVLTENWIPLPRRRLGRPRPLAVLDPTGACTEITALLAEAGSAQEVPIHLAKSNAAGLSGAGDADTVVILVPEQPDTDDAEAVDAVAQFFGNTHWMPPLPESITACWLVTTRGEAVTDDESAHPVPAAIAAGFRTLALDRPSVTFAHLDIDSANERTGRALLTALLTVGESELALRDGTLYGKRLRRSDPFASGTNAEPPNHVVITGGTGKLGLELCEHYSRDHVSLITLISRSGETAEVTERLEPVRRRATGAIRVVACDVADPASVEQLAEELGTPADLIVHAAADFFQTVGKEVSAIDPDSVRRAFGGKVNGLSNVLSSLERTPDCRIIVFSSLAATLGGRGMLLYAAANRMLDALATKYRTDGANCVSVQWGQWSAFEGRGGHDLDRLAELGYVPMDPHEAIRLGLGHLGRNAIVTAFDWERGSSTLSAYGSGSLLADLVGPERTTTDRDSDNWQPGTETPGRFRPPRELLLVLAEVIGTDRIDTIDTTAPMVALGVDSLQALEFRRRVKTEFNHVLDVADLLGGASIDDVITALERKSSATTDGDSQKHGSPDSLAPEPIRMSAKAAAEKALPGDLDAGRMRSAREDLDRHGMHAMLGVLNPVLRSGAPCSADTIASRLQFADRHKWLLNRWLTVLTGHGHLLRDADGGYLLGQPVRPPGENDLDVLCVDLGYRLELAEFMRKANDQLLELGQDRIRVQQLLFADGDMLTAEAGYRDNLISRYLNLAAREVVTTMATRLAATRSPVRILELGAGTGGTTGEVISGLATLSGVSVDYHFTDVSAFFLAAAQERFAEYPQMRYGIMDLNTDLPSSARYDIVVAANVVHNALHIGKCLRQLHDSVNPGGAIVFIEACNANYQLLNSMKFLMSAAPGQQHPGQHDLRGGTRIFLSQDEWNGQLAEAGFSPLVVLPEPDHPMYLLDQRIFAAVRA